MNEARPLHDNSSKRGYERAEHPLDAVRPRLDGGLALGQLALNCGGRALYSRSKRKIARRPIGTGSFSPLSRKKA